MIQLFLLNWLLSIFRGFEQILGIWLKSDKTAQIEQKCQFGRLPGLAAMWPWKKLKYRYIDQQIDGHSFKFAQHVQKFWFSLKFEISCSWSRGDLYLWREAIATLVAYNHRLGSLPLEDLFPGFQFSELQTIYVRLRAGPLERQDVAMSVRVCKVDRFVELIREPQLVSDGYVTAVCLGEVALPEDGQECSSLIGRHDQLLAKIKEAGQFAAENRAPGHVTIPAKGFAPLLLVQNCRADMIQHDSAVA